MSKVDPTLQFQSVLAPIIKQLIQEKKVCGYKYESSSRTLKRFDTFVLNKLTTMELPKSLVIQWLEEKNGQPSTQRNLMYCIRQLATFMVRLGYHAYVVPLQFGVPRSTKFLPHIFTREEIKNIIHAVDKIKPSAKSGSTPKGGAL